MSISMKIIHPQGISRVLFPYKSVYVSLGYMVFEPVSISTSLLLGTGPITCEYVNPSEFIMAV